MSNAARQVSVEPGFFDLGLILLGFCDDWAQGKDAAAVKNPQLQRPVHSFDKVAQLRIMADQAVFELYGP